ncbi:MAG: PDZ domain-containing protein [Halioglobus sp.]|nr:PDZ domain-containing protein [Halioglobus sp.]
MKDGDVVIALDGAPVTSSSDLRNRIGLMRPEKEVEITYIRDGERIHRVALDQRGAVTTVNGNWQHEALPGAWRASAPDDAPVDGVQAVKVEPEDRRPGRPAAGGPDRHD